LIKTYFFLPAHKKEYRQKLDRIRADHYILDLEDSFDESYYASTLANLKKTLGKSCDYFVRPRLIDQSNQNLSLLQLGDLLKIGFKKFVLPKISSPQDLINLKERLAPDFEFNDLSFILLVENPKLLLKLVDVVERNIIKLVGIGLGSHDYVASLGMKHTMSNLYHARSVVLNVAKAYKVEAIDVASMNISNRKKYEYEVQSAIDLGYNSKFLIHPFQQKIINGFQYYDETELQEARDVMGEIKRQGNKDFTVIKLNGRVYEKPHIENIIKILKWDMKYGGK
jgi:citrate lyase subunit beta / citryl-CoA lyase